MVAAPEESTDHEAALPELRPSREVGWIFKNGDVVAVERRGDGPRSEPAAVPHRRDSSGR